jgi:hypothetical protein
MSSIAFLDILVPVTDLLVIAVVLKGLGLSLGTTAAPTEIRLRAWLSITLVLLAWYGVSTYLAVHDVFRASSVAKFPGLPFARRASVSGHRRRVAHSARCRAITPGIRAARGLGRCIGGTPGNSSPGWSEADQSAR